ncbi:MAG TPA: PKD domain-containing protein [Puia sp.]|nr:PKD domain-containing protein [Puia sp.]
MPFHSFEWKRVALFLTAGLLLIARAGFAQLNADFTPDKTAGCSPLTVTFTNKTTGASPAAAYTWVFGNGNTVNTNDGVTPVGATYFTPGIYTVRLDVKDGAQISSKTATITVFKGPVVDFNFSNATGCLPLSASFNSISTPGDGSITSYFWDFGDGNTLVTNQASVNNLYQFAGTYSVGLTVTNSDGCSNTLKKINIITVLPQINPAFSSDSTVLCNISDPVQFNNTTTGTGPLSYLWSFGDGASSTSPNPSHQYAAKGVYDVQLIVTNTQGCSAKLNKTAYVNAADFNPDFAFNPGFCSGAAVTFKDASTPAASGTALWNFGDGGSSIGNTVSHVFASPGNYTIQLTDTFGHCVVTKPKTITVAASPTLSGFIFNKGAYCQSPMQVSFSDTSSAAIAWHWNFTGNPADTSDLQNPSFTYATNGLYTPTLTVTNTAGCSTTISEPLNSAGPVATIAMDTTLTASTTICAIVNAQFKAISTDTLVVFNWDFGDGTTSSDPNPTHSYTVPGTYIVNLSFTTNHGCTGTAFPPDTVRVYPIPHALFNAMDSLPCTNNQAEIFTNLWDSAYQFRWLYGDGSSDINNDIYHLHYYNQEGNYLMTLIASSPGCKPDTFSLTRYVKTTPLPYGQSINTCDSNRLGVIITDSTTGASEYIWSYGDGSVNDTDYTYLPQRVHEYPDSSAVYNASLTAVFGSCIQTAPVPVYVLPVQHPVLSSSADTICQNGSLPVRISGLDTNYRSIANGSGVYYDIVAWQFSDGTTMAPQGNTGFQTIYNGNLSKLKPGEDSVRVIIRSNIFGCYDTSNFIPIHINGPVAVFGAQDDICYSSPVIFTDSSYGTNGVPITQWVWNFGDGNSLTRTTADTVMHYYAFPGNYTPTLTVTDSLGCTAKVKLAINKVTVLGSKADFYWSPVNIAPGSPVTFYNSSITNLGATFQWFFKSDGSTSTDPDSVVHTFTNIGYDTVRLVASATTAGTCADTSVQLVIVNNLAASFTYTTQYIDHANCPPMVAYFVSTTKNAISLHWDFGDGATADNNPNPSHTYNLPGTYVITLTAYGANGLTTSCQDSLTVKGPYAVLYSSLLQACIPAIDTLHATASYADSYTWDFGDGTIISTTDTLATHQYILPGLFTPALIMTDSTGCQVTFRYDKQLLMDTLHISPDPAIILCDTGIAWFSPKVMSYVADSLGMALTWHWDFGTGAPGDTSNIANDHFTYTSPGDYLARVQVSSPIGCVGTATDTVHVVPPLSLSYRKDTTICPGFPAPLAVTGADSYQWLPDASLSNIQGGTAIARPATTTVYKVIGQDRYHCYIDTALLKVEVAPLPTVGFNPTVITIPGGSNTVLNPITSADVVKWNWSPMSYLSCDTCATPAVVAPSEITYTLTVTNNFGCTASADISIRLSCSGKGVYIPNAFSPNHDGNNDLFYPVGSGVKGIKIFQVYSRWGQLLFSKQNFALNDHSFGWDGTLNGIAQPAGTYVYMAEVECYTGEVYLLKGTVELLR